jgi:predicted glycoside hydrolase/deacetylase ChbG (UPF0249 family)
MKYLIVNGDDFGASCGTNRGIVAAHREGILTSASLMVTTAWSEDAAVLSRTVPALSIGLHVHLSSAGKGLSDASCRAEVRAQLDRFQELLGRLPTHLDSHHNVHRDPRLRPHFLELAREYGLPLRQHSPVRYLGKFYGQWGGQTHAEQISVSGLLRLLETELQEEGVTELSCHPGYVEPGFQSTYRSEREIELRTLCDPAVREALAQRHIRLVSYRHLGALLAGSPG